MAFLVLFALPFCAWELVARPNFSMSRARNSVCPATIAGSEGWHFSV